MKNVQFLSNSPQIEKISKGFNLSRSLFVSSLLIGEEHTGKKTFIKTLFPNSIYVDASNEREVLAALEKHDELIIYNFEKMKNIEQLNFEHKRIVAIANTLKARRKCSDIFAFIYEMPSLKEREDLDALIAHFQKEIQNELMIEEEVTLEVKRLDLTHNIKSLRASIYKELLLSTFTKEDIQAFLYAYLFKKMEGNNAYREHLGLFEEPLIRAGLKKFKSQLKLAGVLGLNRNTLRKKIQEYAID
jgi:DNA-binding protein Fis